jgi:hypothetical protein
VVFVLFIQFQHAAIMARDLLCCSIHQFKIDEYFRMERFNHLRRRTTTPFGKENADAF